LKSWLASWGAEPWLPASSQSTAQLSSPHSANSPFRASAHRRLIEPDLVAEFIDEYHREVNRQRHGAELERASVQSELVAVLRKLDGLVRRDR